MTEAAQDTEATPVDDAYALSPETVEAVREGIGAGDRDRIVTLLDDMHPADIADLLEQISSDERRGFIGLLGSHVDGAVLTELEEGVRDEILEFMPHEFLAAAMQDLDSDDVVYLVGDLEGPLQGRLLDALDDADRNAVTHALNFPEGTAGRMMQRELVIVPQHWSVGNAIDFMRESDDLPDLFYDLIVVDAAMHPVGMVPLGRVMSHPRDVLLADLMTQNFHAIPTDQSQEDVAYAFNQYHMVSAPVVDAEGRLVGVITIDDAMEVLEDEAEEDMKRLAGVRDEELSDTVWSTAWARFPWLAVNLATSILASIVIAQFTDTIETLVALAVLMPIVASMGGNAGTQTLTVAVRAIATRDLTSSNAMRIVKREALVGLGNGVVFALIAGVAGFAWFGDPMLGVVLGIAMIGNLLVAGLAGILIPMGLDRIGVDPALASGAFVTTVTDIVGFFAFLWLAATMLL